MTVDHEITVDGVDATQACVALLFRDNEFRATGTFTDRLIYERGGWYFTSRELEWDLVPRERRAAGVSRRASATNSRSAPTRTHCGWSAREPSRGSRAPR